MQPTRLDSVELDLFAIPWAERADGVEGWVLTGTCLESCSSVRATGISNGGIFKDASAKRTLSLLTQCSCKFEE